MPKVYSEDLRWRVVYLYNDYFSITDIANTLYISKSSVIRIINLYKNGHVLPIHSKGFLVEENSSAGGICIYFRVL